MSSDISFEQVDNLVLTSPKYRDFNRVSRYMCFIDNLGTIQRHSSWRDYEYRNLARGKSATFKTLNPDSYYQRLKNQMDSQCIFDISTKLSTLYKNNSITLCLDLTQGMMAVNYDTGDTYGDEMIGSLKGILKLLVSKEQSTSSVHASSVFSDIKLSVILFDDCTYKCILFDRTLNMETLDSIMELLYNDIYSFLSQPKEDSDIMILQRVIQHVLFLYQQPADASNSILLITNGMMEINFTSLHQCILSLIQHDIPFHALLLSKDNGEGGNKRRDDYFESGSSQLLEQVCHLTRGRCWTIDMLSSALFIRTIDVSVPYLHQPSIIQTYPYSCLNSKRKVEEYASIPLESSKHSVPIEAFLKHCMCSGFELDHISVLSKTSFTFFFILPLMLHHHLKIAIYTNEWGSKISQVYIEIYLVYNTRLLYQFSHIRDIAKSIMNHLFTPFTKPETHLMNQILVRNSPVIMTNCFDLFFQPSKTKLYHMQTVLDTWLGPYRALSVDDINTFIQSVITKSRYSRMKTLRSDSFPIFSRIDKDAIYQLQPYVKKNQFLVHCTLRVIPRKTEDGTVELLLQKELESLRRLFQLQKTNDFLVELMLPSMHCDQTHCTLFNMTLMDCVSDNSDRSPILCHCIPEPIPSVSCTVLHEYQKTKDFVLQQSYAQNVIKWLHANHFRIWQIEKKNGVHFIYMIKDHEDYMILYECCSEYTCIKLLYCPYIQYSIKQSLIPLHTILQKKEDRQQIYMVSKDTTRKTVTKETVSIEELISMYRDEIAFNYALFHSLSSLFCWSIYSNTTDVIDTELTKDIGMLLLSRAIHVSRNFYAFIPKEVKLKDRPFCVPIERSRSVSYEANRFLYDLMHTNFQWEYNVLPSSVINTLKEIASLSLDYAYMNKSKAFYQICDINGNRVSHRDDQFYLFIVFLHELSTVTSEQQLIKLDYFFLSPSFFSIESLMKSESRHEKIPQVALIDDLYNSCYLYTLYHSIIKHSLDIHELSRFLSADNCSYSNIDIDLTPLIQALPYLSEKEHYQLDCEVIKSLNLLPCYFFEEYFLVDCHDFPCIIRLELVHVSKHYKKVTCPNRCLFPPNGKNSSLVDLLKGCIANHCREVVMRVSIFCPRQKIHLNLIQMGHSIPSSNQEEDNVYTEINERYFSNYDTIRKAVGNEDANMATIKQIVTTFSSVIASRSLQVLEEHLFDNLSYLPVIHDLLGDLNIVHSVYSIKHALSISPSINEYNLFLKLFSSECSQAPNNSTPAVLENCSFIQIKSYFLCVCKKPKDYVDISHPTIQRFVVKNNLLSADDDPLLYETYHLDQFYLPFICIFYYDRKRNDCYFRLHDPQCYLQNLAGIQQSDNPNLFRERMNALTRYQKQIQDYMELRLYEAKNRLRMKGMIESKQMINSVLINASSRLDSISFKLHLSHLYSNKIYFPFILKSTVMQTPLIIERDAVCHFLEDLQDHFKEYLIKQSYASPNYKTDYPDFLILFFEIYPSTCSFLTVTMTHKSNAETCSHICSDTWILECKVWGWEEIIPDSCNMIIQYVNDLALRYKIDHISSQYDEMVNKSLSIIETDHDVVKWIRESNHMSDSFTITLNAICTPSVFLCLLFKAMNESQIYPVSTGEKNVLQGNILPEYSGEMEEVSSIINIGNKFNFIFSSNSTSKNVVLIEVSLVNTSMVDGEKVCETITALPRICKLTHLPDITDIDQTSVFQHIPTSLHGEMKDKLYDGLELQVRLWCVSMENKEDIEKELASYCRTTLSTIVRQARVELFVDFHLLSLPDYFYSTLSTSMVPSILTNYTKFVISYHRRKDVNIMNESLKDLHIKDGVHRFSIFKILPVTALHYITDTTYQWVKERIPQNTVVSGIVEPVPFTTNEESPLFLRSYHAYKHDGKTWSEYTPQPMETILGDESVVTGNDRNAQLLHLFDIKTDVKSSIVLVTFSNTVSSTDSESEGDTEEEEDTESVPEHDHHEDGSHCPFSCYQNVMKEFTHTPYIIIFISHRYIYCISRGIDELLFTNFTERVNFVVNNLLDAHTLRNVLLMQHGGRTQFIQSIDALQVSFMNNSPSSNVLPPSESKFYQLLKTVRLPTQLAFMNNKQLLAGEVKKVSANIVQSCREILMESNEIQQRQETYENIFIKLPTQENVIHELNQLLLKDYTLVHKCYNLPIPVNSVDEKTIEESTTTFMFGNRTTRKNRVRFRFSHRRTTRGDTAVSNSSTAHSLGIGAHDSGTIEGGKLELRSSVESLSTPIPSDGTTSTHTRTNTLYGLLAYIKKRISIHIPTATSYMCANEKETNPWMVVIESREPYIFYFISLRSYLKSIFINIYSNVPHMQYSFPFLMLYNEYSSILYFQRIQFMIESNALSHLHINEMLSLPTKLPRPVTKDKCCYARQIRSTQFNIHPSPRIAAVFVQQARDFGLIIHEDSAKNLFSLVPIQYPKSEVTPAGMELNDSAAAPSPVEKTDDTYSLTIHVEGIEFCYLFCIPSTLSFTLITQFHPHVSNTCALFETICQVVTQWTERFYHDFTEVCSSRFSDVSYVDVTCHHIDASLFVEKVRPLLLFFRNQQAVIRIVQRLNNQLFPITDLTNEVRFVYALNKGSIRYLLLVEFNQKTNETVMNIIDTRSLEPHDMNTVNKIVEVVLQTLHKETFGF